MEYNRRMKRSWYWSIAAVIVIGVASYLISSHLSALTSASGAAAALSEDAYPLYPNATWQKPKAVSFSLGSTDYSPGVTVSSAPITDTLDPGSIFMPFMQYYSDKLKGLGYAEDNALAAGGHTGGQSVFRKGTAVILTRFEIDYKNIPENAPSECPCDVTLTVFTSGK